MKIKCGHCGSEYEPRWVSVSPVPWINPRPYPYTPYWSVTNASNTTITYTYTSYPYGYNGYYDYSCPVCGYGSYVNPAPRKYIPPIKPKQPYDWRPYEFTDTTSR